MKEALAFTANCERLSHGPSIAFAFACLAAIPPGAA